MKKVFCILFTVLILLPTFVLIAGAEEVKIPSVMQELEGLYIDGKQFSEADYPLDVNDQNLYVLAVVEKNFLSKTNSPEFELYFYLYNPSCIAINDDVRNSVQIGLDEDCKEFSFYGVRVYSKSSDGRFIKFGVSEASAYNPASQCYKDQESDSRRVYNVVLFRLFNGVSKREYKLKKAYYFEGYDYNNTLKSYYQEFGALDVELHSTNWISPNAGLKTDGSAASIYDHYEINTVYFSIPKDVYYQYEYLKSIRATYDALRLTPIIVTRPGDFDQTTIDAITTGKTIWKDSDGDGDNDYLDGKNDPTVDVMDLFWQTQHSTKAWIYSENDATRYLADTGHYYDREAVSYNYLSYYFESLLTSFDYDEGKVTKAVVSSEDLEAYFYERYNDPYYDNSKLYSEMQHFEIDYCSRDFDDTALYNLTDFSSVLAQTSKFNQWWTKLTTENDSYLYEDFPTQADHITVIKEPSTYSSISSVSYETVANELFIGVNDLKDFSAFCQVANNKNEVVVLLRFGFSDYRCQVVRDVAEYALGIGKDVGVVIDKWAYLNISLAHLVFYNEGADITIPVASNIVDSFGDLDVTGKPTIDNVEEVVDEVRDSDWWQDFLAWLKKAAIVVAIVVVILLVVWVILKFKSQKVKFEISDENARRKRRK